MMSSIFERFTSASSVLLALLLALAMHSCTVEKRRYTSGYHVEWHRNTKQAPSESELSEAEDSVTESFEQPSTAPAHEEGALQGESTESEASELLASNDEEEVQLVKRGEVQVQNFKVLAPSNSDTKLTVQAKERLSRMLNDTPDTRSRKRTNVFALLGFICAIIGFFRFTLILASLAIIFGVIGFEMIRQNKRSFKGVGFALLAILLGVIELILLLLLLGSLA